MKTEIEIFFKLKFSKEFFLYDKLELISLSMTHDDKTEAIAFTRSRMGSVGKDGREVGYTAEGLTLDEADISDITSIVATFTVKHSNKKQKFKKCTQCTITRDRRYRNEFSPKIVKIVI